MVRLLEKDDYDNVLVYDTFIVVYVLDVCISNESANGSMRIRIEDGKLVLSARISTIALIRLFFVTFKALCRLYQLSGSISVLFSPICCCRHRFNLNKNAHVD